MQGYYEVNNINSLMIKLRHVAMYWKLSKADTLSATLRLRLRVAGHLDLPNRQLRKIGLTGEGDLRRRSVSRSSSEGRRVQKLTKNKPSK